jgi:selT/selW/selH-like putative selenoprotein
MPLPSGAQPAKEAERNSPYCLRRSEIAAGTGGTDSVVIAAGFRSCAGAADAANKRNRNANRFIAGASPKMFKSVGSIVATMEVRIRYCKPCRYRIRAEHLAELIRQRFSAKVDVEAGNFGVFKIWVDGDLVFDKYKENGWIGRFGFGVVPPDDVVLGAIQEHMDKRSATPTAAVR